MTTNIWIHLTIFITVFIITGIVISKKAKKKRTNSSIGDYEEIQAEIFEAEDLISQAKSDRKKASEELRKAEEFKRKAAEEWESVRFEMGASREKMKDPYEILGVHEYDTLEKVKYVYLKLMQIYHPDKYETADSVTGHL